MTSKQGKGGDSPQLHTKEFMRMNRQWRYQKEIKERKYSLSVM